MNRSPHVVLAGVPGALIHRLFLTPGYFFDVLVFQETALEIFMREGIQLLQANYCDIFDSSLSPLAPQIVVNLATAEDQLSDACFVEFIGFINDNLKATLSKLFQGTNGLFVPQ